MSSPPSPALQAFHPVTFADRGAAVPFTSPLLAGARARPSERGGIELIIPNPAGGRGVYVVPWTSMRELCRPTVHDMQLNERIAALRSFTPGAVRQAAREVAMSGLAGREANAAARAAEEIEAEARMLTNFHLLLRLVQQIEPRNKSDVSPENERPAELERRAKRTIARIAPRLGQTPEIIAGNLEELSALLCSGGLGGRATQARLPRLLATLKFVRQQVADWAESHDDAGGEALLILAIADLTLACAGDALLTARTTADQVLELLVAWRVDAPSLTARIARPDWLVDGWEQICLVWTVARRPAERIAALHEMTLLLPIIPREARDWVAFNVDMDLPVHTSRNVSLNQDWRTGVSVFDEIARNEHLRALAA